MLRRCIECPALTTATRCVVHERARKSRRNADRAVAAVVRASSAVCGRCGLPFTADDPSTAGHKDVPFSKGGQLTPANSQAEHRSCNTRRRDRY